MRFFAQAAPSGGAAKLIYGLEPGTQALVFATSSATPPDPQAPGNARVVVDSSSRNPHCSSPFVAREDPPLEYHMALDTDLSLSRGVVYYHLFTEGSAAPPLTAQVDAQDPYADAVVNVTREFMYGRLEYHLKRFVTAGRIHPKAGLVPILEQESLSRDQPLPCVLIKETIMPSGEEAIGKHTGEDDTHIERAHRYRVRLDLLAISDNAGIRNTLANLIHEAVLMDFTLLEDAGWREVSVQRNMRSQEVQEGYTQFAEEISLDGNIEMISRVEKRYSVTSTDTYISPI